MNTAQKEVLQANLDAEKKTIRELKQVYSQARKDCETKIAELSARTDMQNVQSIIYQKQYQQALKGQIDGILNTLQSNSFSSVSEYLGTSYTNGYVGVMYDLNHQGIPIITPINQDRVVKALQTDSKISKGLYSKMGEDVGKLKTSIRAELSRGAASGTSWTDIASHIANGMNSPFNKAYNHAILISRTEGHRVQNQSALDAQQAAKAKGADVLKQWNATLDGSTRPTHAALDGQIVEVDEEFTSGGLSAMCPGGFGDPAEDCNCRCALSQRARWALDKDELQTLKDRASYFGLDKTASFEDFKEKYLKAAETEAQITELDKCKSVEDVENLFKSKDWFLHTDINGKPWRSDEAISFKGCDLQAAKDVYSAHAEYFEKYPQMVGKLASVTSTRLSSFTYAQCSYGFGHGGIAINATKYADVDRLAKSYANDLAHGFHPAGTDYTAIVTHELGHATDDYLSNNLKIEGMKGWKPKEVSAAMSPRVMRACGLKIADVESEVSGYATRNAEEWFAECFAEYMKSDSPRKVATEFGKQLEEIMKGVK